MVAQQQRPSRQQALAALQARIRQLGARAFDEDPLGVSTVRSAGSLADQPRQLGELALRGGGNMLLNANNPLGLLARAGFAAGTAAQDTPELARLLAGVLTGPNQPDQPVESALAASEAGLGAGAQPGPSAAAPAGFHRMPDGTLMPDGSMGAGQAPLGAPTTPGSLPPTPPGGYTHGVSQMLNPAVPEGTGTIAGGLSRVDDIASGYGGGGLTSTALVPTRPGALETRPGVAGSMARVDDIGSSYSPRRLGQNELSRSTGLTAPSGLGGGLSPEAMDVIKANPALYADILNQQRGRSPTRDMWAAKERNDIGALNEFYPLFEDPNNINDDEEQRAYLQRGVEGRRMVGGRLPFREALLTKLGDEAGSGEVLDALGIPMSMTPEQVPAAARQAGLLVGKVQLQGGRLPAMAQARAQRVEEEITRQHVLALQSGEAFGQPQISAIIRAYA